MKRSRSGEIVLRGINASPGICIGKAYLVDREGVDVVPHYAIADKNVKNELKRFRSAVQAAKAELRQAIAASPKELQKNHILESHVLLLGDKRLYGRTLETIERERVNAEWALKSVVADIRAAFQAMPDAYLRERMSDIVHLSDLIMRRLMGTEVEDISEIEKRVILVAHDLSPADTSRINLERVKGFITDLGGKTSHTGIIARTLEIPAVVGLEAATRTVRNDDLLIVDGSEGVVIVNPRPRTLKEYEERQARYERYLAVITRESRLRTDTRDGRHFEVMANIELPEEVVSAIHYGADGIGLYRTEFQYLGRSDFPAEEELFEKYRDVVEVMAPRPVTIRTLDINGDKALAVGSGQNEPNPALGLRAIRYCLKRPEVFRTQLRAILRAAAFGPVRLLFPMIAAYFELQAAKRALDEAAESLERDRIPYNRDIAVGVMIEVPAAVVIADLLAPEVDFFSIGTNDLIQYALAIDRGNQAVAHMYQPLDPAIIRMIHRTAEAAKANGIGLQMCGEMAGEPLYTPLLLGLGMDELSMNPQTIPMVKRMIRAITLAEIPAVVDAAMKQRTAREVFQVIREAYGELVVNHRMAERF